MATEVSVADLSQPFWINGCPACATEEQIKAKATAKERRRILFIMVSTEAKEIPSPLMQTISNTCHARNPENDFFLPRPRRNLISH
jgi:hypothetical protein